MKIKEMFEQKRTVFSMEIFPPKFDMPVESIYATLDGLKGLEPDYISVTYGAGGKSKDRTVEIARKIREEYGIESMAHLTCISHSKEEVAKLINDLKNAASKTFWRCVATFRKTRISSSPHRCITNTPLSWSVN